MRGQTIFSYFSNSLLISHKTKNMKVLDSYVEYAEQLQQNNNSEEIHMGSEFNPH